MGLGLILYWILVLAVVWFFPTGDVVVAQGSALLFHAMISGFLMAFFIIKPD